MILVGAGFLMLPFAVVADDGAPFLTALFTSTSAVCVTGLAVVDTGTYWSPFGQVVIMLLIQIGGLGIMTLASIGLVLIGRRLGLRRRVLGSADKGGTGVAVVKRLAFLVASLTLTFEAIGAVALSVRLATAYDYPSGEGRLVRPLPLRSLPSTTPGSACWRTTSRRSCRTGRSTSP